MQSDRHEGSAAEKAGEATTQSKSNIIEDGKSDTVIKEKPTIKIVDLKEEAKEKGSDDDDPAAKELIETPAYIAYEKPAPVCSFFNGVKVFMKFCMHSFFRDITVVGKHNIPKRGPVIFCGNH